MDHNATKIIHPTDVHRGKCLVEFRMSLYKNDMLTRIEFVDIFNTFCLLLDIDPIKVERYRKWENGYSIPNRYLVVFHKMGMNMNWLFSYD